MSDMRVPPQTQQQISNLAASFGRQIEKAAGTEVGQQAEQVLKDVAKSIFAEAKGAEGKDASRLPNALNTLQQKLKELGVDGATIGEVLNRLNEMLGKNRAMRPGRTLKKHLKGAKLAGASPEKMAELEAAMDSQEEAANLLEEREQQQQQAKKGRYGNF
ncbi:MAG TPA: hypothetical protein VFB81_00460 [Myxococcales bacterium]|nr:hypothetical protein [Myxococcales bacterium]